MEFNPKKENERRVNNIVNVFAMTPYDEAGGGQEAAIDLLADLRHFCRVRGIGFEAVSRIAEGHFLAEVDEEEDFNEKIGR